MRISDWSSDVCSSDLRDPLRHQSHRSEDEGERNGREDLEDALDPQMDDPPAPILHDRDVRALAIEKTRAIEEADGDGRDGKQREHALVAFAVAQRRQYAAQHQSQPEDRKSTRLNSSH